MARPESGGPNSANFKNQQYDALFAQMKTRPNDAERRRIIEQMRFLLENERPWIELFHPETYSLVHGWLSNVRPTGLSTIAAVKYYDVDGKQRAQLRASWNEPIIWPALVFVFALIALVVPGVVTFYRERQ